MTLRLASIVIACTAVLACNEHRDTPAPAPPPSATSAPAAAPKQAALRMRPKSDRELPTTSATIFLGNLDGQITELERLTKVAPKDASRRRMLSALVYSRAKVSGDLDEIQRAIAIAEEGVRLGPAEYEGYLQRADEQQALHRFAAARADVEKAKTLGAKPEAVAGAEQELDWNAGKYDAAIAAVHAATAREKSMKSVAREAQLHHDLGEEEAADRAFEEAEDLVMDTNPVPVAWLDVQRAIHEVKVGKLEIAVAFLRDAVRRVPAYVMAEEHLAETLHALGQDEEATAIYENVTRQSRDPEFMGALASIYRAHGKTKEADALRAAATKRYAELLAKYPEAMGWHASEYFLGEGGEPKKALELLRKNAELRPNSTSFVALARAALVNGADADAKTAIDRALAMPLVSAELFWTAARVYARSGDAEHARAYEQRARGLNPRIDQSEPAIAPLAKR